MSEREGETAAPALINYDPPVEKEREFSWDVFQVPTEDNEI